MASHHLRWGRHVCCLLDLEAEVTLKSDDAKDHEATKSPSTAMLSKTGQPHNVTMLMQREDIPQRTN
eukprot:285708-Amphidinium_carterae.2